MSGALPYLPPNHWIRYDVAPIVDALVAAKATILSLQTIPYQRAWVDKLQQIELKREVAGTSRIEGAEFTERELEIAMQTDQENAEQVLTRSQRQARAAVATYRWIATLPLDLSIDEALIRDIHRRVVTGADDDHCPPGVLRTRDQNVSFGAPRHRGVEGGPECAKALASLTHAIQTVYQGHDPLIRALAAHYHFAAMHPFLDGNGRTARALEALMLQRAGLRDTSFIAMSNYYHDEKTKYLATLASVRQQEHDLTAFLQFGLRGIASQSTRLLGEIRREVSKGLFRNLMFDLFQRLRTPKRRVIAQRQLEILKALLDGDDLEVNALERAVRATYKDLKAPSKAFLRDLNELIELRAVRFERRADLTVVLGVRLEWPTEITETTFFEWIKRLPKAKTHSFLS